MKRCVVLIVLTALLAVPGVANAMSRSVSVNGVSQTLVYKPHTGTINYSISSIWAQTAVASKILVEYRSANGWQPLDCPKTVCDFKFGGNGSICICPTGYTIAGGRMPTGGVFDTRQLKYPAEWLANQARTKRLRIRGVSEWGGLAISVQFSH